MSQIFDCSLCRLTIFHFDMTVYYQNKLQLLINNYYFDNQNK